MKFHLGHFLRCTLGLCTATKHWHYKRVTRLPRIAYALIAPQSCAILLTRARASIVFCFFYIFYGFFVTNVAFA